MLLFVLTHTIPGPPPGAAVFMLEPLEVLLGADGLAAGDGMEPDSERAAFAAGVPGVAGDGAAVGAWVVVAGEESENHA